VVVIFLLKNSSKHILIFTDDKEEQ